MTYLHTCESSDLVPGHQQFRHLLKKSAGKCLYGIASQKLFKSPDGSVGMDDPRPVKILVTVIRSLCDDLLDSSNDGQKYPGFEGPTA